MIRTFLVCLVCCLSLVACSQAPNPQPESGATKNPTPSDYLKKEKADFFVINGIIYTNVEDAQWVQELAYELGEQIGEIQKQTDKESEFENFTANQLPVGTKIYKTNTRLYIAIVQNKEIPYIKMIEG